MDQILIGLHEKWRVLLLSFDELTQVSRCCMSGKFEILSGNCQGNVREFCFHWSVATLYICCQVVLKYFSPSSSDLKILAKITCSNIKYW